MSVEQELVDVITHVHEETGRVPESILLGFWPWRTLLDELWPKMGVDRRVMACFDRLELDGVEIRHVSTLDPEAIVVVRQ